MAQRWHRPPGQGHQHVHKLPPAKSATTRIHNGDLEWSRPDRFSIFVYKNGDEYDSGMKIGVTRVQMPHWISLLDYLTDRLNLVDGSVQRVYTLDGEEIRHFRQFENHGKYVAAHGKFRRRNYGGTKAKKPPFGVRTALSEDNNDGGRLGIYSDEGLRNYLQQRDFEPTLGDMWDNSHFDLRRGRLTINGAVHSNGHAHGASISRSIGDRQFSRLTRTEDLAATMMARVSRSQSVGPRQLPHYSHANNGSHNFVPQQNGHSHKSTYGQYANAHGKMINGRGRGQLTNGRDQLTNGRGPNQLTNGRGQNQMTNGRGPNPLTNGRGPNQLTNGRGQNQMTNGRGPNQLTNVRGPGQLTKSGSEQDFRSGSPPYQRNAGHTPSAGRNGHDIDLGSLDILELSNGETKTMKSHIPQRTGGTQANGRIPSNKSKTSSGDERKMEEEEAEVEQLEEEMIEETIKKREPATRTGPPRQSHDYAINDEEQSPRWATELTSAVRELASEVHHLRPPSTTETVRSHKAHKKKK